MPFDDDPSWVNKHEDEMPLPSQEMSEWGTLIAPLADTFITWKYDTSTISEELSPPDPSLHNNEEASSTEQDQRKTPLNTQLPPPPEIKCTVDVYNIFSIESTLTISHLPTSISISVDLATHSYLVKTPISPTITISFQTLKHFHCLQLRQPSLSIETFSVISEPSSLRRMKHVYTILGWDADNWRVINSCPAYCYELQDEMPMEFSRLWAHDGNNSLK
ncbi:hypothetical protein QCA50_019997 [Cerrena zonata]|uniref:Uncharacterized protein n=1 Tax=Cerrena zonata TaxID=2478898 RepID=A0AAW0FB66_9APHY